MQRHTATPLKIDAQGEPLLYSVRAAYFQLEELEPADEERLEAFNSVIETWFGNQLRWTGSSVFERVDAFSQSDFELVSCYVRNLVDLSADPDDTGELRELAFDYNNSVAPFDEFEVSMHDGAFPGHASPWSYRFFSVIRPYSEHQGSRPRSIAMLKVTAPETCEWEEFAARFEELASTVRLRWASAGLGFSGWERLQYVETSKAIYAHARRHAGYDVDDYFRTVDDWFDKLRSVSWKTLLGPALREPALRATSGSLLPRLANVSVAELGENLIVTAGSAPAAGDHNRNQIPAEYREADRLLRSVRATACRNFSPPWDDHTTREWLRRFE